MPERGARPNVHPVQRRVLDALGALSSPLLVDDYLELINPLWSTREPRVPALAFPGSRSRPKPGPYQGPMYRGKGEHEAPELREAA